MKNRRESEESSLSDVLKIFIEKNKLQAGLDEVNIKEAWQNVMGNGVVSYTLDIKLKGTTLWVAVSSSVLREELSYGREKIISMLNEELRRDVITDVILK